MAETARTYYGPWINWTYGVVRGSTLTLSIRDGSLLTAFLALFVAVAANAIWNIVAFAIHQKRADQGHHDGLHHQQQAIFRNTGSPSRALWEFVQLFYFWRSTTDKPFWRSLSLALTALLCLAILGVASVFTSQAVGAYGQETLIISDQCGLWSISDSRRSMAAFELKLLQDTLFADTYSRACYGIGEGGLQCRQFFKRQIDWKRNTTGTCPFSSEICRPNTAAYEMDTRLVDSHNDLGINTPKSDRIGYRKKASCAILERDGYYSVTNVTANQEPNDISQLAFGTPGDIVQYWNYGPLRNNSKWTFRYNTHTSLDEVGYGLTSLLYSPNHTIFWTPIDALRRDDADVSIIFMNPNSLTYAGAVHDPFFAADFYNATVGLDSGQQYTVWSSNNLTSVMACTEQHQLCNPNNGQCTDLTHYGIPYDSIGLNPVQDSIAGILTVFLSIQSAFEPLDGRGASALRAQDAVRGLRSAALADNQWHTELDSWFALSLIKLQRTMLEFAAGASNITDGAFLLPPADSIQQALCSSQMVPAASDTIGFSIAGVAIVLVVGALLIITNLVLEALVGLYQRKMNVGNFRRLQWILDGKFQLQRLAYEEAGMGQWSGGTNIVPVTLNGDKFGISEDVDLTHPRLRRREKVEDGENLLGSPTIVGE